MRLEDVFSESVVKQPMVQVREAKAKKAEKGKGKQKSAPRAPWAHYTNDDMIKVLRAEYRSITNNDLILSVAK